MSKKNLKKRLDQHLRNRNIDKNDARKDLPVSLLKPELVPLRGSIHISSSRIAPREYVDRIFSKIRFS